MEAVVSSNIKLRRELMGSIWAIKMLRFYDVDAAMKIVDEALIKADNK